MKRPNTLPTASIADLAYTPLTTVYQMMSKGEIEPVLPPPALNGGKRYFDETQGLLFILAMDLVRAGAKFPLAARWAVRIAEHLHEEADAERIHIEFRRNGAMFFFTTDEAPDAAKAAGPARFRVTFDLAAYRTEFRDALLAEAQDAAA